MNTKFERLVTSYLVTIGAFTAADVPFVFMNRVVRDARPIELLLAQEGRATGLLNRARSVIHQLTNSLAEYLELKRRDQITGLFNGWRRTLSKCIYMWGPANAIHEVAKVRSRHKHKHQRAYSYLLLLYSITGEGVLRSFQINFSALSSVHLLDRLYGARASFSLSGRGESGARKNSASQSSRRRAEFQAEEWQRCGIIHKA